MKLYEIDKEIEDAEILIDEYAFEHDGDITDCPMDSILDGLKIDKDNKILQLASWYKNTKSDTEALERELKTMTARKKASKNKQERIKNYIQNNLSGGKKLSDYRCKVSWRRSSSVLVLCDVKKLPSKYQKIEITAKVEDMKRAIKAGAEIEGVEISDKLNIQIA